MGHCCMSFSGLLTRRVHSNFHLLLAEWIPIGHPSISPLNPLKSIMTENMLLRRNRSARSFWRLERAENQTLLAVSQEGYVT